MTKPLRERSSRIDHHSRCGGCQMPVRWGEACVFCGATYTETETSAYFFPSAWQRYDVPIPERLRVAHGQTCSVGGEPHGCHCGGGKTHPCGCYESPGSVICHICGTCDCRGCDD